ncbi:thermonuclease family protein [Roseobacter weihaiensis]|uniref:thermonuclease family protein n=1 Tax=Roseobacter weihaiensis TaxID=2763262 RepID=UPI001D0BA13B|nr:thermonuclease family protein [Roseobacter sp. H9]
MKAPDRIGVRPGSITLLSSVGRADVQSITIKGALSVFDGDTLEIGPVLIRLHGIDAPENGQTCSSADGGKWQCGAASSQRLSALIDGREVTCGARNRDPCGRIVASCEVSGVDLGATLVGEGLAWAFVEYSDDYVALETQTRSRYLGVWQAPTQTPWDYRDDKWHRAVASAPQGCPTKGNISPGKATRKIYHTPWSPNYGNTKIDTKRVSAGSATKARHARRDGSRWLQGRELRRSGSSLFC